MSRPEAGTPIRWGFLGAGGIAASMAGDLYHENSNMLHAVGARDSTRAAAFAARFGGSRSYDNYVAVIQDPDVDIIYIATTHPFHRDLAMLAIEAGKPVLVEKPLAVNAAQARQVLTAARDEGLFAMEAMWMRTNPLIVKAQAMVADGVIGDVMAVHADFSIALRFNPTHRLFELANGGGALLDLGVYPINFAWLFLGRPDSQQVLGTLSPTGSDAVVALQWGYASGATAQLRCATTGQAPGSATITGTLGSISFEPWFVRPEQLVVTTSAGQSRVKGAQTGYGPQIQEVERCLREGLTQSPLVPLTDTIAILELIDQARAELGVRYPGEA
jgi:predicted dehydrogenase